MERDGTPVFFETISFWGSFYGEGGFSPAEALFILGGSAEKKINNPTVGPDYFVLQKPPSSQKCLNNFVDDCGVFKINGTRKMFRIGFDDGSTRYQV